MDIHLASIDHIREQIIDLLIQFGPRLLTAILIVIAGVIVGGWAERWQARALRRFDLEPPLRVLLSRVTRGLVLILFLVMALQNLGVQLLPLIAGLGVAGAGLALATQGVLSNVMAGLSIIFSKPFRVGEYIAIAGVEGVVQGITLFSTTLVHVDHSHVVVPNRKIVGEILHNYGRIRQLDVSVGVAYDTDLPRALALIEEVLRANARILTEPAAVVQPVQLGDSSVGIAVRPWVLVEDLTAAGGEITAAVLAAFNSRGVVIPVPQREVRLIGAREASP
jgi:small conductance mechanosensitive channel